MSSQKKVAVVTGASKGIGRAIAVALANQGCDIVVNYHSDIQGAQLTAQAVEESGAFAMLAPGDVGNYESAKNIIDAAVDRFGSIDILVNNAGVTNDGLLVSFEPEDIERVIKTNLLGVMFPTQCAAMHMMRQRSGRIINVSSSAASKPGKGQSNYAAAKGGVESFTKAMAVELAPRNILVNAVAPGVVATDMSEDIRKFGEDEIKKRLLLKRYADPAEIADAVSWLALSQPFYMTGEILHLNGGLKMA